MKIRSLDNLKEFLRGVGVTETKVNTALKRLGAETDTEEEVFANVLQFNLLMIVILNASA